MKKLEHINFVCPKCGKSAYMCKINGRNVGHLNVKCANCNSYFNYDELRNEYAESNKDKASSDGEIITIGTSEKITAKGLETNGIDTNLKIDNIKVNGEDCVKFDTYNGWKLANVFSDCPPNGEEHKEVVAVFRKDTGARNERMCLSK